MCSKNIYFYEGERLIKIMTGFVETKNLYDKEAKPTILEIKKLSKKYSRGAGLHNLNLDLQQGKIVALLGTSGSGKTTLMKLLAGVLTPTSGEATVCGIPVGEDTKDMVAYLPDKTYLNDWMKVSEIVKYFGDFYKDFDKKKAFDMLADVGINAKSKLKTLSTGEKEKVQLVLTMARKAKLYLLDEPLAGLDPIAREYVLDMIVSNYNEESSIIIATHLVAYVENIIDDFIFINNGDIILKGNLLETKKKSGKTLDELFMEVYKQCSNA